jgi:hypothetical protein
MWRLDVGVKDQSANITHAGNLFEFLNLRISTSKTQGFFQSKLLHLQRRIQQHEQSGQLILNRLVFHATEEVPSLLGVIHMGPFKILNAPTAELRLKLSLQRRFLRGLSKQPPPETWFSEESMFAGFF